MLLHCAALKVWSSHMDSVYLYYAGFAAGLFYLLGDLTGGFITPSYNYIRNAVSELVQSGAENRRFLSIFFFIHAIMIVLFAVGILVQHSFSQSWLVFVGGLLLLAVGSSHALSSSIFPMDPVGTECTFPGRMHLILVGVTVVSIFILMPLLGIGFSQLYGWDNFATYTIVSMAVIVVSGVASPIVINRGIEVMGLTERITGYTFYVWMAVLAYLLISSPSSST
jgi:hypothetical protein